MHPAGQLAPTGIRLVRFTLVHPQGDLLAKALAGHIKDDRLAVETGPIAMQATFATPHGERTL
jgi:hypothetical protein